MTTNRTVRVRTGARLHFGPLSLRPESGRDFGGWGVMIDAPNCQVACRSAEHDAVIAAGDDQTRITKIRDELRERFGVTQPLRIEVLEQIPPHRGLGSGTQLVLAAATAMTQSLGHELPLHALAEIGQRGRRSAVGIHGFATGGLLVDAGHRSGEALGAIACRLHFPEDWRFVLLPPGCGRSGRGGRTLGVCGVAADVGIINRPLVSTGADGSASRRSNG